MIPATVRSDRYLRDVRQILSVADVGLRFGDNVGPVYSFRYLASAAPVDVATGEHGPPLAVVCLAASNRTDSTQGTDTGARIRWQWRGGGVVRVFAVDVSAPADEYDVKIGVWRA